MKTPIVFARDTLGVWHVATATFPAEADTLCGKHLDAHEFSTMPTHEEHRPKYCVGCRRAFQKEKKRAASAA